MAYGYRGNLTLNEDGTGVTFTEASPETKKVQQSAVDAVRETAGNIFWAPYNVGKQIGDTIEEGVKDAGQDIKDALDDSMEKAGQAAKDAGTGLALPLAALAAGLLWVVSR